MDTEETRLAAARQRLRRLHYEYSGRRPASETLLNGFELILDEAEGEFDLIIEAKERDIEMRHQGRLEQAEKREQVAVERYVEVRDEVVELRRALDGKRALREERIREGDDVRVTIERGHQWSVASIEDIAYRLRLGGATDETEVHLSTTRVVAYVPDPNMVRLGLEREAEAPRSLPTVGELWHRWRWTAFAGFATFSAGGLLGFLAR